MLELGFIIYRKIKVLKLLIGVGFFFFYLLVKKIFYLLELYYFIKDLEGGVNF